MALRIRRHQKTNTTKDSSPINDGDDCTKHKNIERRDDIRKKIHKSILIAMPKKPDANEYEMYWTLSLMSNLTKLIGRFRSSQKQLELKIVKEQCGFVKDTGMRNADYMISVVK